MQRESKQPFAWLPNEQWDGCIVPVVPGPPPAVVDRCDACGQVDTVAPQVVAGADMRLCVVTATCVRRTAAAKVTS